MNRNTPYYLIHSRSSGYPEPHLFTSYLTSRLMTITTVFTKICNNLWLLEGHASCKAPVTGYFIRQTLTSHICATHCLMPKWSMSEYLSPRRAPCKMNSLYLKFKFQCHRMCCGCEVMQPQSVVPLKYFISVFISYSFLVSLHVVSNAHRLLAEHQLAEEDGRGDVIGYCIINRESTGLCTHGPQKMALDLAPYVMYVNVSLDILWKPSVFFTEASWDSQFWLSQIGISCVLLPSMYKCTVLVSLVVYVWDVYLFFNNQYLFCVF